MRWNVVRFVTKEILWLLDETGSVITIALSLSSRKYQTYWITSFYSSLIIFITEIFREFSIFWISFGVVIKHFTEGRKYELHLVEDLDARFRVCILSLNTLMTLIEVMRASFVGWVFIALMYLNFAYRWNAALLSALNGYQFIFYQYSITIKGRIETQQA